MWLQLCESNTLILWWAGIKGSVLVTGALTPLHQASLYDVYAATVLWAYAIYTIAVSSKTLCRTLSMSNQCVAKARCMN